jgi:RNA polymerase sigma-70 factor (ECF subfamily)
MLQACQIAGRPFIYHIRDGIEFIVSRARQKPTAPMHENVRMMKGDDSENTALLLRIAQADEKAFAELYDRFSRGLFSLVFKILNDQREAEDVLQEGFTQIWKKASTFDGTRSSAFTWAVMIMRNKAIDHIRARQRQTRLIESATQEFSAGIDGAEDGEVFNNEQRGIVRDALAKIPEEQRQAIDLAFFSGLTQQQISEKLGEPLGTVKARIRRGLLKLRDLLGGRA